MKRILITGKGSYLGTSFEKFMNNWPEQYQVDTLDVQDPSWCEHDFSKYDVVFHVAGIAHIKETEDNAHLYYEVNRDLPIKAATIAKDAGVSQFIFLSTMNVYGLEEGVITKDTPVNPISNYGKSKYMAEQALNDLVSDSFLVCVLRPPMVYGLNCKGNFQSVIKLVKLLPVFPKVNNKRSMIFIDNLSSFVKFAIDKDLSGLFFPQNSEYVNTSEMAKIISKKLGKNMLLSRALGFVVTISKPILRIARKGFGSLIYKDTEDFDFSYCVENNETSIATSV